MPAERSILHRFLEKVDFSPGCWTWIGARMWKGYGSIGLGQKVLRAHRVAWLLFRVPIPDDVLVLHRCDNRSCVKPAHLFLGSPEDNSLDMSAKGRWRNQFAAGKAA